MSADKKVKKVNFRLDRGIYVGGKPVFPAKAKNKTTVLSLPLAFAKELQAAAKGEIVEGKANTDVPEKEASDGLDDVFGDAGSEESAA